MRIIHLAAMLIIFLAGCGTRSSGEMDIDEIRERLNRNSCRINRDQLVFALGDLEFHNDTTYAELPVELLADSLVRCPVSEEVYEMLRLDGSRVLRCPSGHGETKF